MGNEPGDHPEGLSPAPLGAVATSDGEAAEQAGGPGGVRAVCLLCGGSGEPCIGCDGEEVLAADDPRVRQLIETLPDIAPPPGWEARVEAKLQDTSGELAAEWEKQVREKLAGGGSDAFHFRAGDVRHPTAEELGLPPDPPDHQPGPPMVVTAVDVERGVITVDDSDGWPLIDLGGEEG